ncbi:hypothetical protein MKZ17_12450 [Solibacillus sp. FSL R7-0682]|uniref:hypothetical protein n=1 Tax=Solibacillus sp. FSL R7-0682 TaxID=2921690 RepID=UPI0030F574D9
MGKSNEIQTTEVDVIENDLIESKATTTHLESLNNVGENKLSDVEVNPTKVAEVGPEALAFFEELKSKLSDEDTEGNSNIDDKKAEEKGFYSPIAYEKDYMTYKDPEKYSPVKISNFILKPLYKIRQNDNEIYYRMQLKNKKESINVLMNATILTSNRLFRQFVRSKGDFAWLGNQYKLDYLNEYLIEAFECNEVIELNFVGYHEFEDSEKSNGLWVFPTFAFYEGNVIFPDVDGIFFTPKKSFMLNKQLLDNLYLNAKYIDKEFDGEQVKLILNKLFKMYSYNIFLGIGFTIATMQVNLVEKLTNQFPFYSPSGITHSGKTEYLSILSKFAGVEVNFVSPPEKIDVLRKEVSYYSHLIFGYDEAQDDGSTSFYKKHEAPLKAYFNRKSQHRGDKDIFKVHKFPIRCGLLLSGEISTSNSALYTRSILVDSASFVHDKEAFNHVKRNKDLILYLGQVMMKDSENWCSTFKNEFKSYEVLIDQFLNEKVQSRVKTNYAILLAGIKVFLEKIEVYFDIDLTLDQFLQELFTFATKEMINAYLVADENKNVTNYLANIAYLSSKGVLLEGVHYKVEYDIYKNPKILSLAFGDAWSALQDSRLNTIYTSKNQVSNDVKTLTYFLPNFSAQKKIGNKNLRVWNFDLQHQDIPEFFQHFTMNKPSHIDNEHL